MDGGNVIACKSPSCDKCGQIVSIDDGGFEQTDLLENRAAKSVWGVEASMSPDAAEVLCRDGRLFLSEVFASDLGSSSGEKRYLAIGFGAE
ncbi:hypothetical protein [Streptomyces sp. ALI-76-A]|jgi:hypothetical protein|uniref:hypothetical protein n=1 Tax=Streptomyces sp. ALI-76-A TaxID=3025736 RepID=UPI00256ED1DF|nr:hypothetical protein [Streptomyces sp. ALI-76-A]MDL5198935.1 hypothetical protein [Streptomyces sp. ALI-76-A]